MKPLEPFDAILPAPALVPHEEDDLTEADNNSAYVDDQYGDFISELRYHISVTKQDLTELFPPDCRIRLERLLGIYRAVWNALLQAEED